jgi:hypothetical protein
MAELPMGISVEIEMIVEVADGAGSGGAKPAAKKPAARTRPAARRPAARKRRR